MHACATLTILLRRVQLKQLTEEVAACSPSAQQIAVFKAAFDHSDGDDAGGSTSPACVYNLTVRELLDM